MIIYEIFQIELEMIERITEEEERASEAIANLAGRNGINFRPLSPSSADIRTLEHEGLFYKVNFARFQTCTPFDTAGLLSRKAYFLLAKFLTNQKQDNGLKLLMRFRSMLRELAFIKQKRFNIYSSFRLFPIPSTLDVRNGIFQFLFQQKRIVKFLIYENIFFCHVTTT